MAPALVAAAEMLEEATRLSQKVIIILTDGDPNDLDAVREVTSELKTNGIRLIFVHVGHLATPAIMRELATTPIDRNVFHLSSYDELLAAASYILTQIVECSRWVRRMKFAASLAPYEVVPDIDAIKGYEIMCPGWGVHKCVKDINTVFYDKDCFKDELYWSFDSLHPMVDPSAEPWSPRKPRPAPLIDDIQIDIVQPEVPKPKPNLPKPKLKDARMQTVPIVLAEMGMNTIATKEYTEKVLVEADIQTTPIVRAVLEPGRHVPMDVVFCIDSSASVCFVQREMEKGKFVETGNIGFAKSFLQSIVHHCDMPEAHFGLIRFEDNSVIISEMTGQRTEFIQRLNDMPSSLGETKMAGPLQQARSLMQSTGRAVKKTLLMVT